MAKRDSLPAAKPLSEDVHLLKAALEKLTRRHDKLGLVVQPLLELRKKDEAIGARARELDRVADTLERILNGTPS